MKHGLKSLFPLQSHVDNILLAYFNSTEEDKADGLGWYTKAFAWCKDKAMRYNLKPEVVAGVLAALSPMVDWDKNLIDCENVLRASKKGRRKVIVSTYRANLFKAIDILDGMDPLKRLGKHKTFYFYRSIVGLSGVCIDRHAAAVSVGRKLSDDERGRITGRVYFTLAAAYDKASWALNLEPRDLQAIVWCYWRRSNKG